MHISREIQLAEGLSDAEVQHLEQMLDEIERSNPSMPPEIWQPDAVVQLDSTMGGQSLDGSLFSKDQLDELRKLGRRLTLRPKANTQVKKQIYDILKDYVEYRKPGDLYDLEVVTGGWMAHLSMPGYMDQTEPTRYDTLKEAIEELHRMFADADLEE
jgi:hypothetical protein